MTFGAELLDRRVDVDRIPEHDQIDEESGRAEPVLLSIAVTPAQFTALAVGYGAGKMVAALAAVELSQDAQMCLAEVFICQPRAAINSKKVHNINVI